MMSLTVTRITEYDAAAKYPSAVVEIKTDRNQVASVRVMRDGSHTVIAGAAWVLKAAKSDLGSARVASALWTAATEGSATVHV